MLLGEDSGITRSCYLPITRRSTWLTPVKTPNKKRLLKLLLDGFGDSGREVSLPSRNVRCAQAGTHDLCSSEHCLGRKDDAVWRLHFVAHVQDLTDRKRVGQELEASRAQMVSSSRLSALGMMAGGIAHEINNPLAVIPRIGGEYQPHGGIRLRAGSGSAKEL